MKEKSVAFYERGSWYHRVKQLQDDYTVKYSKLGGFKTQEEAEESYWKYEKEFKKKLTDNFGANKKDLMFGDFLIYWFDNIYSSRIETTTRLITSYAIYSLILPNIDVDIKMNVLNVDYLNALLEKISKHCKSAAPLCRGVINRAIKDALVNGYISSNPVLETKKYPWDRPKVRILSENNLRKLLECASKDNWYLEILLGLFCGLRKGEILGLKFVDFDLESNTVNISRQLVSNPNIKNGGEVESNEVIERDPKTINSFRTIKVPTIIIEELLKRKKIVEGLKLSGKFEDNDYVSCQNDGKPHGLTSLNSYLTKLCVTNNIPKITVHGLRHMFATILLEKGVEIIKISGLLGHSSVTTTFSYYCEVMDENGKIIAFINNIFTPDMAA